MTPLARLALGGAATLALACGGADGAAGQGRLPAKPDPALERVPAAFREAVGAELKAGLTIADARETPATGGRYYVVIYAYPEGAEEHDGDRALKIYYLPDGGKTVKATDLYVEHVVAFGTFDDEKTVFADVNRDGATDVIVSVANGGNCWQCSRVLLYSLDGPAPRFLASEPMSLKDLDGDGRVELLVGDTRWEGYDDFAHAFAPGGTLVYRWGETGYVFAGKDASDFYAAEEARIRADLPAAVKAIEEATADQPFGDEQYLSDLISLYLVMVYTDRAEAGREEFRRLMNEHVVSDEMRAHRKRILDDFLTGDSAKELASPRRGQALPPPSEEERRQ